VTDDPGEITSATTTRSPYAEKEDLEVEQATAAFQTDGEAGSDETTADGEPVADGGRLIEIEHAEGCEGGDCGGHRGGHR